MDRGWPTDERSVTAFPRYSSSASVPRATIHESDWMRGCTSSSSTGGLDLHEHGTIALNTVDGFGSWSTPST